MPFGFQFRHHVVADDSCLMVADKNLKTLKRPQYKIKKHASVFMQKVLKSKIIWENFHIFPMLISSVIYK